MQKQLIGGKICFALSCHYVKLRVAPALHISRRPSFSNRLFCFDKVRLEYLILRSVEDFSLVMLKVFSYLDAPYSFQ